MYFNNYMNKKMLFPLFQSTIIINTQNIKQHIIIIYYLFIYIKCFSPNDLCPFLF